MRDPFKNSEEYKYFSEKLMEGKALTVSGTVDPVKIVMSGSFFLENVSSGRQAVFVVKDDQTGRKYLQELKNLTEDAYFYPSRDILFGKDPDTVTSRDRTEVLKALSEKRNIFLIAPVSAFLEGIETKKGFLSSKLEISVGSSFNIGELSEKLSEMNYKRSDSTEGPGEFSVRGGIVDIFPFDSDIPFRIEFWDTEVDNIRSFSPDTQRSSGDTRDRITVYPGFEKKEGGEMSSLLDHLSEGSFIFLDEPDRLFEKAESLEENIRAYCLEKANEEPDERTDERDNEKAYDEAEDSEKILKNKEDIPGDGKTAQNEIFEDSIDLIPAEELFQRIFLKNICLFSVLGNNFSIKDKYDREFDNINISTSEILPGRGFDLIIKDISGYLKENYRVEVLSPSGLRASRLAAELRSSGINAYCPDIYDSEEEGTVKVVPGSLTTGFVIPKEKYIVFSEGDILKTQRDKKKKRRKKSKNSVSGMSDLTAGDYVVHEDHGIGIYRGMERTLIDGAEKDFLKIEYRDGGSLFIPADRISGLEKYSADENAHPKLNSLGTKEWQNTRKKVTRAVQEMARELLMLYADRQKAEGIRYSEDTEWQKEFEELFPYEETEDQLNAIEDVKSDMESNRVMDRLICGDVGYGKTEVALRAAFKAVMDGKQVCYLCPTTILSEQITNTFTERMKGFAIRVGQVSRFRTSKEIKETVTQLKEGRMDVVIGTHRLLSKDVEFKDLGLLIVDEEQRFGVTHKEKIKQLRKNVDVLTLSATPIPRTLHMSMVGIRDMSVLEEAPVDRVPIETHVLEYSDYLVREAIEREIGRKGQVFYIFNRIGAINEITDRIKRLVPDLRVECAHGRMEERALEDIMLRFIKGDIDVLVSTTIVETGLDIPNANTMIIHDADRMGLSQLYQLRGRVGRSSRTAYCFLLYRKGRELTEESEKRLKAIKQFTRLGSGIRIAMRDLEIRGAGNVLGQEQHGHMALIGYELYTKLLKQAIAEEKGEKTLKPADTRIECGISSFIPESYIENEDKRLDIYKRISSLSSEEESVDLKDEIIDRFGDIPESLDNLFLIAELKISSYGILREIVIKNGFYRMRFLGDADINTEELKSIIQEMRGKLRFRQGSEPVLEYKDREMPVRSLIRETRGLLKRLRMQ